MLRIKTKSTIKIGQNNSHKNDQDSRLKKNNGQVQITLNESNETIKTKRTKLCNSGENILNNLITGEYHKFFQVLVVLLIMIIPTKVKYGFSREVIKIEMLLESFATINFLFQYLIKNIHKFIHGWITNWNK